MNEIYLDKDMDAEFESYRDSMYQNFDVIELNTFEFIREDCLSPKYKLERIREMLDFFLLEERYDKCEKLMGIKAALEVSYIISELYQEKMDH